MSRMKMKITSFKNGSKRKSLSEHIKNIVWVELPSHEERWVGGISKNSYGGAWQEYRVYYVKPEYALNARSVKHNRKSTEYPLTPSPNTQNSFVLMECFEDLALANAYVKKHFVNAEALKKEMFNVYLKLLQPLG